MTRQKPKARLTRGELDDICYPVPPTNFQLNIYRDTDFEETEVCDICGEQNKTVIMCADKVMRCKSCRNGVRKNVFSTRRKTH